MGEKIKTIANCRLKNTNLDIELNKAMTTNGLRYIHIQNDFFRFDFHEKDFINFATRILAAKRRLKVLKGIKE
jgi:hypothetical protein